MRSWIPRLAIGLALSLTARAATAGEAPPFERWLDNDYYKVSLDVRARVELADFEGLEPSEAYTVRTRLGLGTKPRFGLSAYAEMEHSFAIAGDQYFDGIESNRRGQSLIADPEETDVNQLYLRYRNDAVLGLELTGGRQRIKLDDDRFVGNVGWRQNEQVYDAAFASTSLGVPDLTLQYGYVWDVRRIFGDDGSAAQEDFQSDSHFVRLAFERWEVAKVVLFSYLLDFDNSPGNSSNSYGLRVTGGTGLGGPWSLRYAASYAVQTDAAENPVDYTAHYGAAELGLGHARVGSVAVGYELLGSDDGRARFVTPLATAHKFNGWADAFLNNGGANGLQDVYVALAPKLPWKLAGKVVYHHFRVDEGSGALADEVDFSLGRALNQHVKVLAKGAWFEGGSRGPADRWRGWLEVTFQR